MPTSTAPARGYLHTIDLGVLRFCRETHALEILLNRREAEPFAGHWALPGIVVNGDVEDLTLNDAVERLRNSNKVGMPLAWIEQVGTVGDAFRDPRCWSSSTFYLAIVSEAVQLAEHQGFFPSRTSLTPRSNFLSTTTAWWLQSRSGCCPKPSIAACR